MSTVPKAWLLSAYRADSHAAWADWLLRTQSALHWQRLELPGRHFRWRIRGNPLSWLDALPSGRPDLIVATSMVDLATLRGLHPRLATVPAIYYFHENQFVYPRSTRQTSSLDAQMVQLYGALAAQRVLFNSRFNRDTFLDGVAGLMEQMPDAVPPGLRQRLARRSMVLPVPIQPVTPGVSRWDDLIVWNHRWEYDKAPGVFVDALLMLARRGTAFRLALLGARADPAPAELARLRRELDARIVVDDKVDRTTYREVLARAGIVVSSALHEFQGVAVLEAASAGARPLVPDALCYPEQYPAHHRYPADDAAALADRLGAWLNGALPPPVDVSAWYDDALSPAWSAQLQATLDPAVRRVRMPGD